MKNLHLKNLNNIDPIDIYLNEIQKIYNKEHSLKKLFTPLKNLYSYIKKELESINIQNKEIQEYKEHLLHYISDILKYDFKNTKKTTYSIIHYPLIINSFKDDIKNLKLLKNIDINSQWIKVNHYGYYYHAEEGNRFTVFNTKNHLNNFMIEIYILVDDNNIIKKIIPNYY
jgi:hypothetical protein